MNGVTNSVLRVLEHLDRTGHDAMVIAPDTVGSDTSAATEHEGVQVVRVPAVMVPKVSSLPVGLPQPRLTTAVRTFAPDVVPSGVHRSCSAPEEWPSPKRLGIPTVRGLPNRRRRICRKLRARRHQPRRMGVDPSNPQELQQDPRALHVGSRRPRRARHSARAPMGPRRRRTTIRAFAVRSSVLRPVPGSATATGWWSASSVASRRKARRTIGGPGRRSQCADRPSSETARTARTYDD